MSDLLPQLPAPRMKQPQKPTGPGQPLDDFLTGFVPTLVIGAQLISKTAPVFAEKITENMLGPQLALGAGVAKYPFPKPGMLFLPAPFGFADPVAFGLQPNYLNNLANQRTTLLGVSNPFARLIPESYYLHTLPDTHPQTQYDLYAFEGRQQRRTVENLTRTATLPELVALYTAATGPNAAQSFYSPTDIANSLEASIKARAGLIEGERIVMRASGRLSPDPLLSIPEAPLPLLAGGFHNPTVTEVGPGIGSTDDLFAFLERSGVNRPTLGPPTLTAQQEANDRAPPLLKELASERSDP